MTQSRIVERLSLITISIYIIYTFWYQYFFSPVSGFLNLVGVVMLLLSVIKIQTNLNFYNRILAVGGFIIYCMINGLIFSNNVSLSMELLTQIVKYCIPLYAIYIYIQSDEKRFDEIMQIVILACGLLAISSFFKSMYTLTYAAGIINEGGLNANVFSSYMMLGVISCTFILTKSNGLKKYALYVLLVTIIIAQLNAASRRGILICIFIVLAYFHTIITVRSKQGIVSKMLTVFLVISIIFIIANEFSALSSSFLGIQRLQGLYTGGDVRRNYYHHAATELFKKSPLFGKGLGAVSNEIGMYSHSFYYELLACTGFAGTAIMLIYIIRELICFGKNSLKRFIKDSEIRVYSRLMFWYTCAILICGVAVVMIYDSYFYVILSILACSMNVLMERINCYKQEI